MLLIKILRVIVLHVFPGHLITCFCIQLHALCHFSTKTCSILFVREQIRTLLKTTANLPPDRYPLTILIKEIKEQTETEQIKKLRAGFDLFYTTKYFIKYMQYNMVTCSIINKENPVKTCK
jgi:hypothetical protein